MADVNSHGAFESGDIIKYGYMMIKRPPSSTKVRIKAWQSKFFVLRDKTHNSIQRLEYYKDETAFEFQKSMEYSFGLDSVVYIGETHSSKSHSYPIMVVCSKQGAFTLACDTEKARKDWLLVLNRVAIKEGGGTTSPDMCPWANVTVDYSPSSTPELPRHAYSEVSTILPNSSEDISQGKPKTTTATGYFVTTRLTPQAEQNNIRGDYVLCISDGEVVLQSAVDRGQTVVTWSVGHLRAFKSEPAVNAAAKDMQLLTLHVGRRSSTGEGIFQFFAKHGDTIADEIRRQSQHAFKSAADKRDAFRKSSTNNSESKSPPSTGSPKRLSKMMTAPTGRTASVLIKENSCVTDNARKRANTDPFQGKRVEENGLAEQDDRGAVDDEADGSVSSIDSRPRSATESSVEKAGDDEVFVTRQTYSEIDVSDVVNEESEINPYIDLVSDETAEPIHISDPVPSRKASSDSYSSSSSFGSEEGSMRSATNSLSRTFPNTQLIPEENEMDSEGYIKCEALQSGPTENNLDGNGNVLDCFLSEKWTDNQTCEISSSQSLSSCPVDANNSLEISQASARVNRKTRENLFSQLKEPNCGNFPPKPKLEKEQALKSENVFPPKSRTEDDASRVASDHGNDVDSRQPSFDQMSVKKMYEKIVAQMEKPQQNDVNELFPSSRYKRNSIGAVSTEMVRNVQQKSTIVAGGKVSKFSFKKHSVIEKSKSTCEGFGLRALNPGPPPLPPVRPTSSESVRRRSSSAITGELSEEIQRRPELAAAHRSTFFAKGIGSVDPQLLRNPLKTSISSSHLSGEAAIHARLIEKTEIRDELAQCATKLARNNEFSTCSIADGGSTDESFIVNSDSSEKSLSKSAEHLEDDGHIEMRRKDSKASKFVKKVWKLAPKPRRGSNESREGGEELPEKPRRDSLSPGDVVDIQGRFSGSEPSTPETSPQMSRKTSKSSPKASRKTSKEEKLKKDKESPEMTRKSSSASKILRKMTKGSDAKKDESMVKKISKEESLKKEDLTADSGAKQTASSILSSSFTHKVKQRKYGQAGQFQTDSKDKTSKSNQVSDEKTDASCLMNGQLGLDPDMIDIECALATKDNVPAPALPPRKKFDPPPLPPRLVKSPSSSGSSSAAATHTSAPYQSGRTSQPAAPSTRDCRRHSGSKGVGSAMKEEFLPPPPVPPRRENTQSPDPKKMMLNGRSSARAPVIQLTCSSPENKDDCTEKHNSDSDSDMAISPTDKSPEQNPPTMSATHQSPDSLSHPVPRRPPKGERQMQAREFFRSHTNQQVCITSADSGTVEMADDYLPPNPSSRYGNIDELGLRTNTSDQDEDWSEESSIRHPAQSNYVNRTPPGPLSLDESRVIRSQREAMRLKINFMKETSVDDDVPFECQDLEGQNTPKRPSTP